MHAMNGLTHGEVVTLKRRLELEEKRIRDVMHDEFTHRETSTGGGEAEGGLAQYHETTDDEAIVDVLNETSVQNMTRFSESLRAVEKSLKAIEDGTYGTCEDCNRHIGVRRLTPNPVATRCTPCQSKHERNAPHATL
jgi:DnaK suppressor protein